MTRFFWVRGLLCVLSALALFILLILVLSVITGRPAF